MSSSEHANEALNLVADKIQRIIKKSEKLPMGDSGSKAFAHEIAITLSTAFAQHGHAATSVPPTLLSCAAELRDKSAPNGKLKGLLDWATISDQDTCIRGHPLFNKTIRYTRPVPPASPPPVAAPIYTHPAAQASNSTHSAVASALFPIEAPAPPPPNLVVKPFNLLVPGNKRKAPTSELDDENDEQPAPPPAKNQVSKSGREVGPRDRSRPRKKVKSKKIISDDEDDEVLPTNVIYVKNKKQTENTVPVVVPSAGAKPGIDTTKKPESLSCIFGDQCERCIKYDVACVVAAAKKAGEFRKCCCTCDEKKTKCVRLDPTTAELLRAQIVSKKAKAAAAAEKKSRLAAGRQGKGSSSRAQSRTRLKGATGERATHTTSRVCRASPDPIIASNTEDSADEDAEGDYDTQPEILVPKAPADADAGPAAGAPAATVDNDVDMTVTPDIVPADIAAPAVPMAEQPTLTDVIRTIEALRTRFEGMVTRSSDHAEALHEDMVGRMTTLDGEWTRRFATMEAKIRDVELKNSSNMASIGHMANAMSLFHHTRRPTSFNPPIGPSTQGHPFGQIPGSWFPNAPDQVDQSVSAAGKEYTTAWDLSQGPQPGPSVNMTVSLVRASSEPPQLAHDVYSFPPASPFNSQ
ncbi:uncharacterized protein HD556DRAFT_1448394 [Suillus plorans]|uniref:Uncharacterized protein n=1 Tax=Suillus plorans TaxID=116603 RepID=A0A9P7DD19_9AGAM|nr:uncharacterized protein HD556DRAFT_1448394 [Suillus plorans]KAG1787889.1 hypothetical protein HD556DRAFT_1448394 [Suillus plorans]